MKILRNTHKKIMSKATQKWCQPYNFLINVLKNMWWQKILFWHKNKVVFNFSNTALVLNFKNKAVIEKMNTTCHAIFFYIFKMWHITTQHSWTCDKCIDIFWHSPNLSRIMICILKIRIGSSFKGILFFGISRDWITAWNMKRRGKTGLFRTKLQICA